MTIQVADNGWSVTQFSTNQLVCVSPDGKILKPLDLLQDGMSEETRERFVVDTTAGPMWERNSYWFFLENDQRTLLVIRPWWGKHIVVHANEAEFVAIDDDISDQIEQHERDFVLSTLEESCESYPKDYLAKKTMHTAMLIAGKNHIQESIAYLRVLEQAEADQRGRLSWFDDGTRALAKPHKTRQFAQLSLRRLGETPKPLPSYHNAMRIDGSNKNSAIKPIPWVDNRDENAADVRQGMTRTEVLDLLGIPDQLGYGISWEYDFDTKKPFSLSVVFEFETWTVKRIVRLTPPAWQVNLERDEKLCRW